MTNKDLASFCWFSAAHRQVMGCSTYRFLIGSYDIRTVHISQWETRTINAEHVCGLKRAWAEGDDWDTSANLRVKCSSIFLPLRERGMGGHLTPYLILRRAHWAGLNMCSIVSKEYADDKEYSPKTSASSKVHDNRLRCFVLCLIDFHHISQCMYITKQLFSMW